MDDASPAAPDPCRADGRPVHLGIRFGSPSEAGAGTPSRPPDQPAHMIMFANNKGEDGGKGCGLRHFQHYTGGRHIHYGDGDAASRRGNFRRPHQYWWFPPFEPSFYHFFHRSAVPQRH